MPWDSKKFYKLCYLLDYPFTYKYNNTLASKFYAANYHHKRSEVVWDELYANLKQNNRSLSLSSPEWRKVELSSEAEAISCVHIVNTMVDVFLQMINESLLKGHYHESKVNLNNVKTKLSKIKGTNDIIAKLNYLDDSYEYQYIKSFDNTTKHRRLLYIDFSAGWNHINGARQGIRFKEFEYEWETGKDKIKKLGPFPITWASDVTNDFRKRVIEMIWDVGIELTKHLRKEKNSVKHNESSNLLQSIIFD